MHISFNPRLWNPLKLCLHSHKQPNSTFRLFLGFSGRQHVSQLLTEWSFLLGLVVFSSVPGAKETWSVLSASESSPSRADGANVQIDHKSDFLNTSTHNRKVNRLAHQYCGRAAALTNTLIFITSVRLWFKWFIVYWISVAMGKVFFFLFYLKSYSKDANLIIFTLKTHKE